MARHTSGAAGPGQPATERAAGTAGGYMTQLDGIRAFAVGGVILEHWASGMPGTVRSAVAHLDLGGWGVECFFVLSGFLITGILLQAKEARGFATAIGHFYGRRALRIFPAYYLVLLVASVASPVMRNVALWHALYLGNFYPLAHGTFAPSGGHFWSLAVEEQFYLFWPLLVLLAPERRLAQVALALFALGPLTRLVLWLVIGRVHLSMWTFPTTALDLLAFGAFLACVRRQRGLQLTDRFVRRLNRLGIAALLVYLVTFLTLRASGEFVVFARSLEALVFGALVLRASFGFTGLRGFVLGNRVVTWLGMVSYGLYLVHPFVPDLYLQALSALGLSTRTWGVYFVRIPLMTLMLLGLVTASFYLWERPVRSYRRFLA
jgi:peptidoglycan/LPS O-acetylase OafA/YrhL